MRPSPIAARRRYTCHGCRLQLAAVSAHSTQRRATRSNQDASREFPLAESNAVAAPATQQAPHVYTYYSLLTLANDIRLLVKPLHHAHHFNMIFKFEFLLMLLCDFVHLWRLLWPVAPHAHALYILALIALLTYINILNICIAKYICLP